MKQQRKGFTLVELLAVIMILAVLAAVAVPLYINSRKSAAARACLSNIATIAANETAWATRNGTYLWDSGGTFITQTAYTPAALSTSGLVGAPEGLAANLKCPLNKSGAVNNYTVTQTGTTGNCVIACTNATDHAAVITSGSWTTTLAPPATETLP